VFLPAGTVHAVGGGVLLAEVQQSSDATFRLYDWGRAGPDGRPRTLHVPQALESIDWTAGPVSSTCGAGVTAEQLVTCPYFELRRYRVGDTLSFSPAAGMTIWMVLAGAAELESSEGYRRPFAAGETVLVPAAAGSATWHNRGGGPATLLEARLP
jgi:mannose-6-phosphate isomerase